MENLRQNAGSGCGFGVPGGFRWETPVSDDAGSIPAASTNTQVLSHLWCGASSPANSRKSPIDPNSNKGYSRDIMSESGGKIGADIASDAYRLNVLRAMSPEARLAQAIELSELTRMLFEHGLRRRFADLPEAEFSALLRARLDLCHNRNY